MNKLLCYLYAPLGDYYSYATVARAWTKELHANNMLAAAIDISAMGEFGAPIRPTNSLGIAFGPLEDCRRALAPHKHKIIQIVPDTTWIRQEWVDMANACDCVITPSAFGAATLARCGVDPKKVQIVHHGADPRVFKPSTRVSAPFGLLHPTTATTYWERKGTPQLLEAMALLGPRIPLTIRIPSRYSLPFKLPPGVEVDRAMSFPPTMWADYLQDFEAVICPSRGEGFSMIPLEARFCSVPVILSDGTGPMDHIDNDVDTVIPYDSLSASWGGDKGLAPVIEPKAISDAIQRFLDDRVSIRQRLVAKRAELVEKWSWTKVLEPLLGLVRHYGLKGGS